MPLTKIQARERAKRNQNRLNMMGMRQPPGSKPHEHQLPAEPAWRPPAPHHVTDMLASFMDIFKPVKVPRWMRRRPRQ